MTNTTKYKLYNNNTNDLSLWFTSLTLSVTLACVVDHKICSCAKKIKPPLLNLQCVAMLLSFGVKCRYLSTSQSFCLFLFFGLSPASSLTVFLCLSVPLQGCDGGVAVSEDGLPTQEPASRAVAECPAPQPAQRSSCHAGPGLLRHCESALPSSLFLYLSLTEEERERKGCSV